MRKSKGRKADFFTQRQSDFELDHQVTLDFKNNQDLAYYPRKESFWPDEDREVIETYGSQKVKKIDEFRDSKEVERLKNTLVDAMSFKKREPMSKLTELIGKPIKELKMQIQKAKSK